jgi:hypothetical protein
MAIVPNINTSSPNAVPTHTIASEPEYNGEGCSASNFQCAALWSENWSTQEINVNGICAANFILKEWGIYYTPDASQYYESDWVRTIPENLVRNPDSEWYIACQDLEGLLTVFGIQYSNAQDRYDMCGDAICRCAATIDKIKWKQLFDWAETAVQMQSSVNDIDTCIVESFEDANTQLTQAQIDALNNEEGFGLTNNTMLAIVGGLTLVSIGAILKYVK